MSYAIAPAVRPKPGRFHFLGAMDALPPRCLWCEGGTVSRTLYAGLFAAIGTTYGPGDGSTTFDLPDFRAEFPRGWDNGRGLDAARVFGSAQAQQMQAHNHKWYEYNPASGGRLDVASGNHYTFNATGGYNGFSDASTWNAHLYTTAAQNVSGETRPRNLTVRVAIEY